MKIIKNQYLKALNIRAHWYYEDWTLGIEFIGSPCIGWSSIAFYFAGTLVS